MAGEKMIIITGGAGFIGSCIVKELNKKGITDILIVDHLGNTEKWKNLVNLKFLNYIDKTKFLEILSTIENVDLIVHMGACSDTTEKDADYLMNNNYKFSKAIYDFCAQKNIRLIYASSAAIYGSGEQKFLDAKTDEYIPLNMYGYSKKLFDQFVTSTKEKIPQCVGLRFFNVFGPNEYHKNAMASVIFHAFNQVKKEKKIKLFKSYKLEYKDGEQKRDFVYVKDCVNIVMFMIKNKQVNGIFNVGTGEARSFNDLALSVFKAMDIPAKIEYIDMPINIRDKYQYYTCAEIKKLRKIGYTKPFFTLEKAAKDYIQNFLSMDYKNYE